MTLTVPIQKILNPGIFAIAIWLAPFMVSAQVFSKFNTSSIPALTNARTQWVDFNNDGLLDLFVSGLTTGGAAQTSVYFNNGNAIFNATNLTATTDISFDFGDYDNDGFIDIITSGVLNGGQKQTIIYRNTNGSSFVSQGFAIAGLSRGGLAWKDLDNDGDLDLVMSGLDGANVSQTLAYEFEGGSYVLRTTILPPVSNGQLKCFDAQRDGINEIIITGLTRSGAPITHIYSASSDFTFQPQSNTLEGTAFNSIATGDLNSDGLEDLVVTGLAGSQLEKRTLVLQNNATGFTSINTSMVNLASASVDLGDLNNDGLLDIVLTGQDAASPVEFKHFRYYRNNNSLQFTDVVHSMKNIFSGDVTLGDFDNDGDLDIFQIGNSDIAFEANLYSSDASAVTSNAAPSVPLTLSAETNGSSVAFHWTASNDDHSESSSLTYNLYVSKGPNGANLFVSPLSDITSGYRRISQQGNAGTAIQKLFNSLPEGRYYWSVQAIDNANRASAFSPEQSFAICYDISLGTDVTICYDEELSLEMGSASDVVNWYSKNDGLLVANSNSFNLQIQRSEAIIVQLTRPYDCTVKDTLYVTMAPKPVIDLGNDVAICSGEQFSKTLSGYQSVNWYNTNGEIEGNALTFSYAVEAPQTITAEVFSEFGCVNSDALLVDVLSLPVFSIGSDVQICLEEEVILSPTGTWSAVSWKTLVGGVQIANSASFSHIVLAKDTIVARVTDVAGCMSYDSAIIDFHPLPAVNLGDDRSVCFDESTVLTVPSSTNTVNWYEANAGVLASNTNQFSHHVLASKVLVVEIIDENSCKNYDSLAVSVIPLPQFDLGNEKHVCTSDEILLSAGSGFARVDWFSKISGTLLQEESWFYNHKVNETDTVIARVESVQGCINYDSVKVAMLVRPVFSLGEDQQICEAKAVNLTVPGAWQEVNWYTADNIVLERNSPSLNLRVEMDIPVIAEVYHQNGCVKYDTMRIIMQPLPVFDLGPDRTICSGDPVRLDVGNIGAVYSWQDENGAELGALANYEFTASNSLKTFLLVETSAGCLFRDSLSVNVNPLPDFVISSPAEVCYGSAATASVKFPWQSILWYSAADDTISLDVTMTSFPVTTTTELFAKVIDANQCVNVKSVVIAMRDLPIAIAGEDQLICFGESVSLGNISQPGVGLSYRWTHPESLSNAGVAQPTATPSASTTYTLKVTDEKGCEAQDVAYVEVNPEIVVDAGTNAFVCLGDQVAIGGSPTASGSNFPYSYQWFSSTGEIVSVQPNLTVSAKQTTTYSVFVTTGKCAVEYDSIIVTVNPLPEIIVSSNQSIGAGANIRLSASGATHYTWTPSESLDNSTSDSPIAFPEVTTTYRVIGRDGNGCVGAGEVIVLVQNNLFIPKLFTPNGDGRNDTFQLFGSGIAKLSFSIFDQQGNRVFNTESVSDAFDQGWDGTSKGKPLKNDVYFWTIDGQYFNGEPVRYEGKSSGIIKLMR